MMEHNKDRDNALRDIFKEYNLDNIDFSLLGDDFKDSFLNKIEKLKELSKFLENESIKLEEAINNLNNNGNNKDTDTTS